MPKFAKNTYDMIYGFLGDPEAHDVGFEATGALLGQIVEEIADGEFFTPTMVEYSAKVALEGAKKTWTTPNIRKLG